MPTIPALGKLKDYLEFESSLEYPVRSNWPTK